MLTDPYLSGFLNPPTTVRALRTSSVESYWRAAYWLNHTPSSDTSLARLACLEHGAVRHTSGRPRQNLLA